MGTTDPSEEVYLYLTSISPQQISTNTTSEFENRILPLNLNPTSSYEVALINILFPKYYYCLRQGDENCSIFFDSHIKQTDLSYDDEYKLYNFYNYNPQKSIISNLRHSSILSIISDINSQMLRDLREIVEDSYPNYFPYKELLHYDSELERIVIHKLTVNPDLDHVYSDLFMTFTPQIALVLGFEPFHRYNIFHKRDEITETPRKLDKIIAPYPFRTDAGNDYLYVYSDIVAPTRFGNQIVNILDAIPLPNDESSKGVNPVMYKPLALKSLQTVGIKITNQNGGPIHFEENHSVTCILHIRPK